MTLGGPRQNMSPLRETVISRPRKHLWLAPPRTCTQRVFAYFPFKAHPMKKPHHFSLTRENITPHACYREGGEMLFV